MKIWFVGMHNKTGMKPLDSRSYSGKIIDEISSLLCEESYKTNLADTSFLPRKTSSHADLWWLCGNQSEGDIIVLLGHWVQKHFHQRHMYFYVSVPHPAAFTVRADKSAYVYHVANQINDYILPF